MDAVQRATSRGVEVQIIADIWDWERAKFATALIKSGAKLKYAQSTHDYYLIKDNETIITMGSETRSDRIELLDRNVRRLSEIATISKKSIHIERNILKFDEEWDKIDANTTQKIVDKYMSDECPGCGKRLVFDFQDTRIILTSNG